MQAALAALLLLQAVGGRARSPRAAPSFVAAPHAHLSKDFFYRRNDGRPCRPARLAAPGPTASDTYEASPEATIYDVQTTSPRPRTATHRCDVEQRYVRDVD